MAVWLEDSHVGQGRRDACSHCAQAQSRVSPTQAQVLFATTPLWSAAIAMVLLPAEHLSVLEGVGGALIVVATVLVTRT